MTSSNSDVSPCLSQLNTLSSSQFIGDWNKLFESVGVTERSAAA